MATGSIPIPPRWGKDSLTKYLDDVRDNQLVTFMNGPGAMAPLLELDRIYHLLLEGWINPRPSFPAMFFLRAHSAFKASAGVAMATQLFEANMLMRGCLEAASFGLYIGADNGRAKIWLDRGNDRTSRKRCNDLFKSATILANHKSKWPNIGNHYDRLYRETVDLGAHPNEAGFVKNMDVIHGGDRVEFRALYLQNNPANLAAALYRVARVGTWSLLAAQLIWPGRFELLGLRDPILEVGRNLGIS